MTKVIEVTEVVLRDAHQSLMATRMATEDMVAACSDLDNAGFWSIECWGGATYDACIRFLNEDPWERLRTFKKLMPKTPLQMLLRGQNLLGYRHYADDVVERFADKCASNGVDVFRIFDALNDLRNLKTSISAVKKTGKHAQGTISYTVSPLHTIAAYVDQAKSLQDMGVDSICIKDMAALIKPQAAYDLVSGIKQACGPDLPVQMHVHATTGVTLVSIMKAIEAGLDIVDGANSALCLGPGHNPTEAICEMLDGTEYTHRVDLQRVLAVKKHFELVRPRYQEFYTKFVGVETGIFHSQIPGGMLSNMEGQLKEQGAADKMAEVLAEVPHVRKDSGYPPLVTPSSQIVGTQAVLNVMLGRYKKLTNEFADLMLGYYGKTLGQMNPEVVEKAKQHSGKTEITCRPADRLASEWDRLATDAAQLSGHNGSEEDTLTFAMFPQVAPKFFKERADGPKNLGRDIISSSSAAPAPVVSSSSSVDLARSYTITVEGVSYAVDVAPRKAGSAPVVAASPSLPAAPRVSSSGGKPLQAELSGTVLRVLKQPGDRVEADETYLLIEAMKMETEIASPRAGVLVSILIKEGDAIQVGDTLAMIEAS